MNSFFAVITLVLRALRLWDQYAEYVDAQRRLEREKASQERGAALESAKIATSAEDAFAAQKRIADNLP